MSRSKENASIATRLRSSKGAIVTSDVDSLETIAVGTDGQVLTADSSNPNGIKWADAGSSGLSAGQITDLTDSGESTLHYHATDRALGNATGTLAIANGGTASTTAQVAIDTLSGVSAATAGHVLTKVGSNATWAAVSGAGIGDVSGPASSVSNNVAAFDGATGKLLKDGGVLTTAIVTKTGTETLTNKTMSTGSAWNGTAVSPVYGGTGQTGWTKGDLLYSSATNTLAKLPIGAGSKFLIANSAGLPEWSSALGNGGLIDRPYENIVTTGGVDGWPDRTTPENSLLRVGLGTSASPRVCVAGDAPTGIFMQNYVNPTFTGDPAAYYVGGANFDTIVQGGIGGCTSFAATAYKMPGTYTGDVGILGGRIGADARDATHYGGIITGFWAFVHGDRSGTGGIAPGIEINSFCNQVWSPSSNYSVDPFITNAKRSVMGLLINNYQHAVSEYGGTAGQYQNTFGIALTSLGPGGVGGRAFGYQTGIYVTDTSKEMIRLRGGVYGSGAYQTEYGIKFEGTACSVAGIALGDNKFNWGASSSTASTSGDMLYNGVTGILYMNKLGTVEEMLSTGEVVAGATSNTVNRKVRVKIGGTFYYLLASTGYA
jgi:hypothetical protein